MPKESNLPPMKRFLLIASLAGCVWFTPTCVYAQNTASPRWETRVADEGARVLQGTETFRVGKDGAITLRPDGFHFAVRITRTKETFVCDTLPYTLRWDTTKAPEGWHWLEILLVDPSNATPERVIDSLTVYVRNNPATPLPVIPPVTPPAATTGTVGAEGVRPSADRPVSALPALGGSSTEPPAARSATRPLSSRRRGRNAHAPRLLSLPESVTPETVSATVAVSDNPLSVPRVSTLYKSDDIVYCGLPDGGIATWDGTAKKGSVVRVSGVSGAVRALTVGNGVIYWTAGNQDRVFAFRTKDRSVTMIDAGERSEGAEIGSSPNGETAPWIERLAVLGKHVVLMGTSATRIWNGESELKPLSDILPSEVAQTYSDALVQCYVGAGTNTKAATLVFATPNGDGSGGSLHLWSGNAERLRGDWNDRGIVPTTVDLLSATGPRIALTPYGVLVPEKAEGYGSVSRLQWASLTDRDVSPQTVPLGVTGDYNAKAPQSAEIVSFGASGVWWEQNGVVFHADPATDKRECYMPWNGAGNTITALLADKDGAFVATEKGVRRVVLGQPNDTDGYGGYVRVPLGDDYAVPPTERDQKLLTGIEEWQGVRYKWGGETKSGTDCSGFVGAMHRSLGVNIPRTTEMMARTQQGGRVRDELHYGDTLLFPGHVALYIGNGRTAETVGGSSTSTNGSVSKATIWRRREVIVKRYLP